ncbi:hypothetical protein TNCV_4138391 [Trichonephila clavipes]|nr:hypothetical protein TNCV_4138391 [Trichonephila clavipes]
MLGEKDKALLVKLFFIDKESATVAVRKFRLQKSGKGPSIVIRPIKLVQRIEDIGSLEDRADILHSAVAGFVTPLEFVIPCGGGYVEHMQL